MNVATVTAVLVVLAFLASCATAVAGVWVGRGQSPVTLVLNWAAMSMVLQLFAACIAVFHARADRALEAEVDGAPPSGPAPGPSAGSPSQRT